MVTSNTVYWETVRFPAAMEGAGRQQEFKYGRINTNSAKPWERSICLCLFACEIIIIFLKLFCTFHSNPKSWQKSPDPPSLGVILKAIRAWVGRVGERDYHWISTRNLCEVWDYTWHSPKIIQTTTSTLYLATFTNSAFQIARVLLVYWSQYSTKFVKFWTKSQECAGHLHSICLVHEMIVGMASCSRARIVTHQLLLENGQEWDTTIYKHSSNLT